MNFRDNKAWQTGMELVDLTYQYSSEFPPDEKYGLTAQMRRATVSIPSNIAEGITRRGSRPFLLFLSYAYGSLAELETQMSIAVRQGFSAHDDLIHNKIIECRKIIYGLIRSLRNDA